MSRVGRSSSLAKPLLEVGADDPDPDLVQVEEQKKPLISKEDIKDWWAAEGWKTVFFVLWICGNIAIASYSAYKFWNKPNYFVTVARIGGGILNLNTALILIPVCRNSLTWLRKVKILREIVPFDSNIRFHKMIAYGIIFGTFVHMVGHYLNYNSTGIPWTLGWTTQPGATGSFLVLILIFLCTAAVDTVRRPNFNVFYLTHHTFIIFYALLLVHGTEGGVYTTWKYVCGPMAIYFIERVWRELSSRKLKVRVVSVTRHPSDVIEIQMNKKLFYYKAGQYLFLNSPYLSRWEWHPFTITSSPEDENVSVHIRCVGDWTKGLRELIAPPDEGTQIELQRVKGYDNKKALLRIDGPYGAASEDVFDYKVVLLVGAGIGVTPFASILRTIYLRLKKFREGRSERNPMKNLQKVYFFWVLREFNAFEWFRTMIVQLQSELRMYDLLDQVEINVHLTGKFKQDEDIGAMENLLRFNRPEWPEIFSRIRSSHNGTKIGVFCCGPKPLTHELEDQCLEFSKDFGIYGVRFDWNKENF